MKHENFVPETRLTRSKLVAQNPSFENHEDVVFCNDPETGLRAIIALHDTTLGPAMGGTRFYPYESEGEALRDVLRLSSGMTLKNALAGLDFGGGKAVIIGDPKRDKTPELLRSYAHHINRLNGLFITGEDVGVRVPDADIIATLTPYIRGTSKGLAGDPSPYTAFGVYSGIRASVAHRFCSLDVAGLTVSIQGLGAVGMALAEYLHAAGAKLIISDIRDEAVREARERFDAWVISPEIAHRADADIFAPCALGAILNRHTITEIRARIVAGSANNQLAEPEDGERLMKSGILYAPDYAINAGGVISIAHDGPGFSKQRVMKHVERIGNTLGNIFERAENSGRATSEIADEMARARLYEKDPHKHNDQDRAA